VLAGFAVAVFVAGVVSAATVGEGRSPTGVRTSSARGDNAAEQTRVPVAVAGTPTSTTSQTAASVDSETTDPTSSPSASGSNSSDRELPPTTTRSNNESTDDSAPRQTTPPISPSPSLAGRIVFISDRPTDQTPTGDYNLWSMRSDGSDQVPLRVAADTDAEPDVARDGTWLVWLHGGGQTNVIMTMNADGTSVHQLTTESGTYLWPRISPDGARIVFTRVTSWSPAASELWVMNSDGSGKTRLPVPDGIPVRSASWAPDGNRLVFDLISGEALSVLDLRDGSLKTIYEGRSFGPAWSPSAGTILFFNDDDEQLHLVAPDGTGHVVLTHGNPFNRFDPAWSPDGRHIAYAAVLVITGQPNVTDIEIHLLDLATGADSALTAVGGANDEPAF